jgi:hypothetical protein
MAINYYSTEVYGQTRYYLANAADAKRWHILSGRKTITSTDMNQLNLLTGVEFVRVFEPEAL